MPTGLEAVRPIELAEIQAARERIAGTIVRTPLVRLELGPELPRHPPQAREPAADQRLQAARRRQRRRDARRRAERARGVWTISAGNAGQGVAYAARKAGVPCTVVVIETAPAAKIERMQALGARLVPVSYEVAWKALEERAYPGRRRHLRPPVRRPQLHRRPRHDGTRDPRGRSRHGRRSSPASAAAGCITGVGSAIKALKPGDQGLGRRAGDGRAAGALAREGFAAAVHGLEGVVRRRRRRPERLPAHVGADEAGRRRLASWSRSRRRGRRCA